MSEIGYIYCLKDPETLAMRYIGQTKNQPSKRYSMHLHSRTESKCSKWIASLAKNDKVPVLEILDTCPIRELDYVELFWIDVYKNCGADLLNMQGMATKPYPKDLIMDYQQAWYENKKGREEYKGYTWDFQKDSFRFIDFDNLDSKKVASYYKPDGFEGEFHTELKLTKITPGEQINVMHRLWITLNEFGEKIFNRFKEIYETTGYTISIVEPNTQDLVDCQPLEEINQQQRPNQIFSAQEATFNTHFDYDLFYGKDALDFFPGYVVPKIIEVVQGAAE